MSQHDAPDAIQRLRGFMERASGWYVPYVPKEDLQAALDALDALQSEVEHAIDDLEDVDFYGMAEVQVSNVIDQLQAAAQRGRVAAQRTETAP